MGSGQRPGRGGERARGGGAARGPSGYRWGQFPVTVFFGFFFHFLYFPLVSRFLSLLSLCYSFSPCLFLLSPPSWLSFTFYSPVSTIFHASPFFFSPFFPLFPPFIFSLLFSFSSLLSLLFLFLFFLVSPFNFFSFFPLFSFYFPPFPPFPLFLFSFLFLFFSYFFSHYFLPSPPLPVRHSPLPAAAVPPLLPC